MIKPFIDKHFIRPARKYYRRIVLKDRFLLEGKRWKTDRGDATLRYAYPLTADSLVWDVGGYRGDFAHAMAERFDARVEVFEPVQTFAHECAQRLAQNHKIRVHDYGLGAQDSVQSIHLSDDASSLHRQFVDGDGQTQVKIRNIVDVFHELTPDRVDLMKINIEGGEFEILPLLIDSGLVKKIGNLQIQFHHFVPNAVTQRNAIRRLLAHTHDETWCYEFVWENWALKPEYRQ